MRPMRAAVVRLRSPSTSIPACRRSASFMVMVVSPLLVGPNTTSIRLRVPQATKATRRSSG